MAGAGVMVQGAEGRAPLCASDAVAAHVEDLCFTLGEGPAADAHREAAPVIEPDLARPRRPRWPSFTPLAVDVGAGREVALRLRRSYA